MALDLAVVMPVYNEELCIVKVVQDWLYTLSELNIRYKIIILNDGSLDRTKEELQLFEDDLRVEVINKENSGHGPTILLGYKRSTEIANWTFQCDSDDEMKPDSFKKLWENRTNFDALFGVRSKRKQNLGRSLITNLSRIVIRFFYGTGISDVNTPYRLINSIVLKNIAHQIPGDTFAPNVIISGALCKFKLRIFECPVLHQNRKTGTVSIARWKLWKSAFKSLLQTLLCRAIIEDIDRPNICVSSNMDD